MAVNLTQLLTFISGPVPGSGNPTDQDDILIGTQAADTIGALDGADTIYGLGGNDSLSGGDNDDDVLYGGTGNDDLDGGTGNDHLMGDNGNDTLFGAGGNDILEGGSGADIFVYTSPNEGLDIIQGFTVGEDKIDLPDSVPDPRNPGEFIDVTPELVLASASRDSTGDVLLPYATGAYFGPAVLIVGLGPFELSTTDFV